MKKVVIINFIFFVFILGITELISYYQYYIKIKEQLTLKNSVGLIQNFRYTLPQKDIYPICDITWFKDYISSAKNTPSPVKDQFYFWVVHTFKVPD